MKEAQVSSSVCLKNNQTVEARAAICEQSYELVIPKQEIHGGSANYWRAVELDEIDSASLASENLGWSQVDSDGGCFDLSKSVECHQSNSH